MPQYNIAYYDFDDYGGPDRFYALGTKTFNCETTHLDSEYLGLEIGYNGNYFSVGGTVKITKTESSSTNIKHTWIGNAPSNLDYYILKFHNAFSVNIEPYYLPPPPPPPSTTQIYSLSNIYSQTLYYEMNFGIASAGTYYIKVQYKYNARSWNTHYWGSSYYSVGDHQKTGWIPEPNYDATVWIKWSIYASDGSTLIDSRIDDCSYDHQGGPF
ncbi:MAG: hypothetical protein ACFE9L_10845 [Candidatus Hodarchaeota archaeon]